MGWAIESFEEIKKIDVEAISVQETSEEIIKCDSRVVNEKLTRLRKYIAELVIANDQGEPINLPALDKIREELNIRKQTLLI